QQSGRIMNWWFPITILLTSTAVSVQAGQVSFSDGIYPLFEEAGCRSCHNFEGVASATRLHFPDPDAPKERIEAFGKSLVELVDRENPDNSMLLLKPTNRTPHSGGERIGKGTPEEAALKSWINLLTKLSGRELVAAFRYQQEEAAGHGVVP